MKTRERNIIMANISDFEETIALKYGDDYILGRIQSLGNDYENIISLCLSGIKKRGIDDPARNS